jgi:hypothetical protein
VETGFRRDKCETRLRGSIMLTQRDEISAGRRASRNPGGRDWCTAKKRKAAQKLKTNAIVLRVRQTSWVCLRPDQACKEVTMTAIAEVLSSTLVHSPDPRVCDLPTCPVCADSMVAAEASAYVADDVVSYLWSCETCGYGFVTKHAIKRRLACY